jgi:hypothetical protein
MRSTPNLSKISIGLQGKLAITPAVTKYMMLDPGPYYSEETIEIITNQLAGSGRIRHSSFAASSLSLHCYRAGVFQWLGATQNAGRDEIRNAVLSNLFLDGHWRHLRWQAVLLECGVIDTIEHLMQDHGMIGTADGVNFAENFGVEIKGCNSYQYTIIVRMKRPLEHHIWQVHAYMLLTGMDLWYVLYENKDTNDWKEFRIERDPLITDEILRYVKSSRSVIELKQLPEMLPDCKEKIGAYRGCNYTDVCERSKEWPRDQDVSVSRVDLPTRKGKRGKVTASVGLPSVSSGSITEQWPSNS